LLASPPHTQTNKHAHTQPSKIKKSLPGDSNTNEQLLLLFARTSNKTETERKTIHTCLNKNNNNNNHSTHTTDNNRRPHTSTNKHKHTHTVKQDTSRTDTHQHKHKVCWLPISCKKATTQQNNKRKSKNTMPQHIAISAFILFFCC